MRAQSNNVYRSLPDDAAPTRYSARPSGPSPYRSSQPSPQQRPKQKHNHHQQKPPAKPPPPGPKKRATEQELKQERRIQKLQELRTEVMHNQVREVVESIVLQLGDDRLLDLARAALRERDPVVPEQKGARRSYRRYTIFVSDTVGAALNARAKAEAVDRILLIDRILSDALGVPLDSVKLKPSP